MSKRTDDFEKELRALLKKYAADIEIQVRSGKRYVRVNKIVINFNSLIVDDEVIPFEQTVFGSNVSYK